MGSVDPLESDESWMWDPEVEWSSSRSSQVNDFASFGSESELESRVSNRYSDPNLLSLQVQVEQVPDLETVFSTVTAVVTPRDSFALKQEAFQLKVQELRKQRDELFQAQQQQRDAHHNDVLRVVRQKQEHLASSLACLDNKHSAYERNLASQKHLTARQKEIERREREESLAEYRKQIEGIRGFSQTAGRVRNLNTVNPTIRRTKYNTLAPRRRTRQRGSLSRI